MWFAYKCASIESHHQHPWGWRSLPFPSWGKQSYLAWDRVSSLVVFAPLAFAERYTQTDLHLGQLAPSTILRSGPWFCYTWFDIDLLIWIRIVYGWEFTSWLNSQAVFGAEWITTSLVPGTSSPMLPAEVDKRALTDLNIGRSLPFKNTTNPSL